MTTARASLSKRSRQPQTRSETISSPTSLDKLMADTLMLLEAGEVWGTPQEPTAGETLRVIPPELLEQAKTRLAQGRYSHFAHQEDARGEYNL